MSQWALNNIRVFQQEQWQTSLALVVDQGLIVDLVPSEQLSQQLPQIDGGGCTLAPGFIDIQINGGGGLMFNQAPTLETIDVIRRGHWSGGTTAMLPTLITDDDATMTAAVDAVAAALERLPGVLGIHLEGPHLSIERKGVHDANKIRPFSEHSESLLDRLPSECFLLTVAPENMPAGMIKKLSERGVRISAGHTAASYDCIQSALADGLSCFTHLHNAMSPLTGREPGTVGAALENQHSYMGIIIDGFHLHPTTARLSIACKARGKTLLVSDAMATVGSNHNSFELYGETIFAVDGRCATADGTLAGSALDMATAVKNCVNTLDIPLEEALRMASQYPAEYLATDHNRGHLRTDYRADFVLLDSELSLQQTWLGGECVYSALEAGA